MLWKVKYIHRSSQPSFSPTVEKKLRYVIANSLAEIEKIIHKDDIHHSNYKSWNEIIYVELVDTQKPLH